MTRQRVYANGEVMSPTPLSALMSLAWRIARQELWSRRLGVGELGALFPAKLLHAWATMKLRAAYERKALEEAGRDSEDIARDITCLENKTVLGIDGIERLSRFRSAYREAVQHEDYSATRTARHPRLSPVWDAETQAIRSVNLETITRIAVAGRVHEFAA